MTTRDSQEPPSIGNAADGAEIRRALPNPFFWLKAALIVGSVFWIYWPAINGAALMDDGFYLFNNPVLRDPHRLWKAWFEPGSFIEYYPISQTVQWVQYTLGGFNLPVYHLTNIVLHAWSALLVWRVLHKLELSLAWLGGLLFAVHPAMVESVAWMAELKNVLSLPLLLVAITCYIEYGNHRRPGDYAAAMAAFLISMLCKISGAPLPFIFLLYAWWRRGRIGFGDIKAALPFLVIAIGLAWVTYWSGEQFHPSSAVDPTGTPPGMLARVALSGGVTLSYFMLFAWPFGLVPINAPWEIESPDIWQFWPWIVFVAIAISCWHYRAGWGRHVTLGLGFYILCLGPFLGFVYISYMRFTWVMDHLAYVGMLGLIGLLVALLEALSRRSRPIVVTVAVIVLAGGLAWTSRAYASKFLGAITLGTYTIEKNPFAWPAYGNMAAYYIQQAQYDQALTLLDKALEINPDYSEGSYNRALALEGLNRLPEALKEYQHSIHLLPKMGQTYLSYARALHKSGQLEAALKQFRNGVALAPDNPLAHAELGILLAQMSRLSEAEKELREAVRIAPSGASFYCDLGNVLFQEGRHSEALDQYRLALKLDSALVEAHTDLAGALEHSGHPGEAVVEYQQALRYSPQDPWLLTNLASAMADTGRKDDAIKLLEITLSVSPDYQPASDELKKLSGTKPAPAD